MKWLQDALQRLLEPTGSERPLILAAKSAACSHPALVPDCGNLDATADQSLCTDAADHDASSWRS